MVITTGKLSKKMHLVSLLTLELNHVTFCLQDPQEPASLHHLGLMSWVWCHIPHSSHGKNNFQVSLVHLLESEIWVPMFSRNQTISNTNELLNILLALILPTSHNEREFTKSRFLEAKLCLHSLAHWAPMPKCTPFTPSDLSGPPAPLLPGLEVDNFCRLFKVKVLLRLAVQALCPAGPFYFWRATLAAEKRNIQKWKLIKLSTPSLVRASGCLFSPSACKPGLGAFPMLMSSPLLG